MTTKYENYIIDLQHVSKEYTIRNWKTLFFGKPKKVMAINNASLQIKRGEIFALLGPNGAGKSTLIKILATLVIPDSGNVIINGKDATHYVKETKKLIGLVNTNDRSFYWRLSGRDNLIFFGHLYDLKGRDLQKKITEVISLTGLQEKQKQQFGTYSSGERQRLGIARALLSDPEILLMDEATANLDPIVSEELLSFTRKTLVEKRKKPLSGAVTTFTKQANSVIV